MGPYAAPWVSDSMSRELRRGGRRQTSLRRRGRGLGRAPGGRALLRLEHAGDAQHRGRTSPKRARAPSAFVLMLVERSMTCVPRGGRNAGGPMDIRSSAARQPRRSTFMLEETGSSGGVWIEPTGAAGSAARGARPRRSGRRRGGGSNSQGPFGPSGLKPGAVASRRRASPECSQHGRSGDRTHAGCYTRPCLSKAVPFLSANPPESRRVRYGE